MIKFNLIILLCLSILLLSACTKSKADIITIAEDGYLIVNGTKTDYLVEDPDELVHLGTSKDGYWIIDGYKTEYHQDTPIEIFVKDGMLVVFDYQTNIKIKEEKIVKDELKNTGSLFPDVTKEMLDPEYWISMHDDANEIILDASEINEFNQKTLNKTLTKTKNILELESTISKENLLKLINTYQIPNHKYLENEIITHECKDQLLTIRNLEAIEEEVKLEYGIIVNNTAIRSFPTAQRLTSSVDGNFDYFQESGIKIGEGVILYHQTEDGKWTFVSSGNYDGWIKTDDIGVCSKDDLRKFINSERFLIVTANRLSLYDSSYTPEIKDLVLLMGTKLPLIENPSLVVDRRITSGCHVVKMPRRDEVGKLKLVDVAISINEDVNNGYLEYTKANQYKQALKLLGTPYGWGDMDNNRDCSSTVSAIYNCFGFIMPRNTSSQDDIPGKVRVLSEAEAGSLIFTPGHVLFYLGEVNNRHYVLHNFSQYRNTPTSESQLAMCCNITSLNQYRSNGQMYLTSISKIISMH